MDIKIYKCQKCLLWFLWRLRTPILLLQQWDWMSEKPSPLEVWQVGICCVKHIAKLENKQTN